MTGEKNTSIFKIRLNKKFFHIIFTKQSWEVSFKYNGNTQKNSIKKKKKIRIHIFDLKTKQKKHIFGLILYNW